MSRRSQRNVPKLYKDIMVSKRQLTDLRQSINQTFYGLTRSGQKNQVSIGYRKKICQECGNYQDPAHPHRCRPANYKCSNCFQRFTTKQILDLHLKQKHHQCKVCRTKHNEQPLVHQKQFCGQKRIQCQNCGAKVKRKDLNQHVHKCCFQTCLKCQKQIFHKCYLYHLGKCNQYEHRKNQSDMTRTKKISKRTNQNYKHHLKGHCYLPYSILI